MKYETATLEQAATRADPLRPTSLQDYLDPQRGQRALLTGAQALVRALLVQKARDQCQGLNTGGYVSGYRGSPLGTFDQALWKAQQALKSAQIVFTPGVNEDLAATAVWGTQQLDMLGPAQVDGVFAMWYGKGPGVDRSGDPIKHGNYTGTHPRGGVVAVFGDDHPGKSSTVAHHSEQAMAANSVPVLYPSNVQEILDFALYGFALSRYSGCWTSLKVVNETIEQTATVDSRPADAGFVQPDRADLLPGEGVHFRGVFEPARDESILLNHRLPLVDRFARANPIDLRVLGDSGAPFGIVTAGKAYQDTRQALFYLGIDEARAAQLGIAVFKVGLVWPLQEVALRTFARGKKELLFIEEKTAFLEPQAAAILYNLESRPAIIGKHGTQGERLLPSDSLLDPVELAKVIGERLRQRHLADGELERRLQALATRTQGVIPLTAGGGAARAPYFCSGCPHATSTNLPDDSIALAGIGCHGMALYHKPRTHPPTHMGGEGMNWASLHHFSKTKHVFQNLGDGTYFHSGLLAVRGAVASRANITYKILFNDAVAMTGGQPVDGTLSVANVARQVLSEGVARVVVVSDQPEIQRQDGDLPAGVQVHHRDALDAVQRALREIPGCTVLIYAQTCAAEKRRRRKRGRMRAPDRRAFINERVCEGCGDCSVQSGCISVEPRETEHGDKRAINQHSCNLDFSCTKGFCPSFVTVVGGSLRRPERSPSDARLFKDLPAPPVAALTHSNYAVLIAGIGGTGVVTVGAVLAMAAHLEYKSASVYDMTGLAQKNGAVFCHVRIAARDDGIACQRIGRQEADLVLAFDVLAAVSDEAFRTLTPDRSRFLGNDRIQPSASFVKNPTSRVDHSLLRRKVVTQVSSDRIDYVDATGIATALCGDAMAANTFLLGAAAQRGWLPVSVPAIERAIEMNGVQTELNLQAFRLGRLWVHDPAAIRAARGPADAPEAGPAPGIEALVQRNAAMLAEYQDGAYAQRYLRSVGRIMALRDQLPNGQDLVLAVARSLAKLMAYKDEYEVARLHTSADFRRQLASVFDGRYTLRVHLAPPLFARKDPVTGKPRKREFGAWMFAAMGLLSRGRRLRGTPFDLFGYTAERRMERGLIAQFEAFVEALPSKATVANAEVALQLARLPDMVRGYGHVKEQAVVAFQAQWAKLTADLDQAMGEAASAMKRA